MGMGMGTGQGPAAGTRGGGNAPRAPQRRLHPATPATFAAVARLLVIALNHPAVSAVVLGLALVVGTYRGRGPAVAMMTCAISLPGALSMVAIHAPHGQDQIFAFVTRDGLVLAGVLSLRFLALVAVVLAAVACVDVPDVAKAIQASKAGYKVAYIVGASLQLLPRGTRVVGVVRDANRLEGRAPSWRNLASRYIGPVVSLLLYQATAQAKALTAVGFDQPGPRTVLRPVPDTLGQRVFRWAAVVAGLAVVGWSLWS
ncbi:ABC transporter permease [Corynebacterium sp. LK2590]|uniref:ABC transporter permease n=1 Tax=unclassified Corynebacterium TaxID=2624378 RepID=UPI0034CE1A9E